MLTHAQEILERAYLYLAADAVKNKNKRTGNTVRCCKCNRCDVTLRKISKDTYACVDCIKVQMVRDAVKRSKK